MKVLIRQSFQDSKNTVTDNDPTDNIKYLIAPFTVASKVSLIQHDKNYGRTRSRNASLENAPRKYAKLNDFDAVLFTKRFIRLRQIALYNEKK